MRQECLSETIINVIDAAAKWLHENNLGK